MLTEEQAPAPQRYMSLWTRKARPPAVPAVCRHRLCPTEFTCVDFLVMGDPAARVPDSTAQTLG